MKHRLKHPVDILGIETVIQQASITATMIRRVGNDTPGKYHDYPTSFKRYLNAFVMA